jgi:glycosyltransferase involved in cell wall biosynthesis
MDITPDKVVCFSLPGLMRVRPFYWFVVSFYGMYLIRRHKVSLILNYNIFPHGFNAFLASLFTGKPVIFAEINEDTIKYHQKKAVRPLIRAILGNAARILVPGSKTEGYWKKNGFAKMIQLHSTVNTDFFKPEPAVIKQFDFIYIGEFDMNKRPDLILEAFVRVRESGIPAKMLMIGFGVLEEKLHHLAKENKVQDSVTFQKTNQPLEYLHASKIFVMASRSEGLPCALLESMACGLIPIVPDVGDICDVVKTGKNGIIYDGTKEQLGLRMKEIYLNYKDLAEMRHNARETIVRHHSYQTATSRWNDLLDSIEK